MYSPKFLLAGGYTPKCIPTAELLSLPEVSLTQLRGCKGGPLQPMPAVTIPFERLDVDRVSPLAPAPSWHRYILVEINYATQYP